MGRSQGDKCGEIKAVSGEGSRLKGVGGEIHSNQYSSKVRDLHIYNIIRVLHTNQYVANKNIFNKTISNKQIFNTLIYRQ